MNMLPLMLICVSQCGPQGCYVPLSPTWRTPQVPTWRLPVQPPLSHLITPTTVQENTLAVQWTIQITPPDGKVWVNGQEVTLQNGQITTRTPSLEAGQRYTYEIRAQWGDRERRWKVYFPASAGIVRVRLDKEKGATVSAPATVREEAGFLVMPTLNFGLAPSEQKSRAFLNGQEISREEAYRLLSQGGLTDDRHKLRLTVIGSEAARKQVEQDLRGALADLAHDYLVQTYPPDHWAIKDVGFRVGGDPTIYVQAPDGTVLHRQDDYQDGPEGLRKVLSRLRKCNPNYDPSKDCDFRKKDDGPGLVWRLLTAPFRTAASWVLFAGLVFLILAAISKGWLWFLLGIIIQLIPSPPPTPTLKKKTSRKKGVKR